MERQSTYSGLSHQILGGFHFESVHPAFILIPVYLFERIESTVLLDAFQSSIHLKISRRRIDYLSRNVQSVYVQFLAKDALSISLKISRPRLGVRKVAPHSPEGAIILRVCVCKHIYAGFEESRDIMYRLFLLVL